MPPMENHRQGAELAWPVRRAGRAFSTGAGEGLAQRGCRCACAFKSRLQPSCRWFYLGKTYPRSDVVRATRGQLGCPLPYFANGNNRGNIALSPAVRIRRAGLGQFAGFDSAVQRNARDAQHL